LQELQKYISIDSYGSCLHNKDIPKELDGMQWYDVKWDIISKYKFVISFENSIYQDYVTEKLFHSFITSTIPIYLGAPNVKEFTPSNHSIINVDEFKGPKELAEFILYLDKNDEKYNEYFLWKKEPPNKNFLRLQKTSPRTGPCRLCMEVAKLQRMQLIN